MPAQCIWKLSDRQDLTDERNDVRTAFFVGKIMMQKQFMVTQGKEKLRFQQIVRLKGNKFQWKQQGMIVYARNCGTHKMKLTGIHKEYGAAGRFVFFPFNDDIKRAGADIYDLYLRMPVDRNLKKSRHIMQVITAKRKFFCSVNAFFS